MNEMYVVIEYNQASHRPSMAMDEVYDLMADAEEAAEELVRETREVGRRERYAIASLSIEWESD